VLVAVLVGYHRSSWVRTGARSLVPLADRAIGNLQQWLIGTYHGMSRAQLQPYLDEFVFRHNRRTQPMAAFQTLLGLIASPTAVSRSTSRSSVCQQPLRRQSLWNHFSSE
jgi:hypothetical protein